MFVGRVAEVQAGGTLVVIGTLIAESQRRTAPPGRVQFTPLTRVHATDDEHICEIGFVMHTKREFRWLAQVVVDGDSLRVVVSKALFAANAEAFLAQADVTHITFQVWIRELKHGHVTLTGVSEQRHGRRIVE